MTLATCRWPCRGYDADGDTDVAVYRPSSGQWFVAGDPPTVIQYGQHTDVPLPLPAAVSRASSP